MGWLKNCRKIVAIGRNYADHAKELGNAVPKEPMLFLKPTSSFITAGQKIEVPSGAIVHHELELGVVIGKTGRDIPKEAAESYVSGYFLALDMTARNIQDQAKQKGHPWTVAKGYDTFTPVGEFIEKSKVSDPYKLQLKLKVDEKVTQDGSTGDMIFTIPTLIEHVSKIMTLESGDVILTGTPKGVGPVVAGQLLTGTLTDKKGSVLSQISFPVIDRK
jgi:acylpyruvate hydrolase